MGKKDILSWLAEFKGEPSRKKKGKRRHSATDLYAPHQITHLAGYDATSEEKNILHRYCSLKHPAARNILTEKDCIWTRGSCFALKQKANQGSAHATSNMCYCEKKGVTSRFFFFKHV